MGEDELISLSRCSSAPLPCPEAPVHGNPILYLSQSLWEETFRLPKFREHHRIVFGILQFRRSLKDGPEVANGDDLLNLVVVQLQPQSVLPEPFFLKIDSGSETEIVSRPGIVCSSDLTSLLRAFPSSALQITELRIAGPTASPSQKHHSSDHLISVTSRHPTSPLDQFPAFSGEINLEAFTPGTGTASRSSVLSGLQHPMLKFHSDGLLQVVKVLLNGESCPNQGLCSMIP